MPSRRISDKLYFRIGEAAEIVGVKPHVLRYWEEEFSSLRSTKSRTQQRLYQRKDIDFLLRLKELLHDQGYTIAGARKFLRAGGLLPQYDDVVADETTLKKQLVEIRDELHRLRTLLDTSPTTGKLSPPDSFPT